MQWAPLDPQPRAEVRLAFLALQCLETAMPYGGTVRILAKDGIWTAIGQADKLNLDDNLWSNMGAPGTTPTITPALVQFALLPAVADDLGRAPKMVSDGSQLTIRF